MNNVEQALAAAYQAEIINLYKAFSEGMITAKDHEPMISGTKERFKVGIERAAYIHQVARSLAGL